MSDVSEDYGYGIDYVSDEERTRELVEHQASGQRSLEQRVFVLEQAMQDAMSVIKSVDSNYLTFDDKYLEAKFHRFKGDSKRAKEKLSEHLSELVSEKRYDEAITTANDFYYARRWGYYSNSPYDYCWVYAAEHPVLFEPLVERAKNFIEKGKYYEYASFMGSRYLFSTHKMPTPAEAFEKLSDYRKDVYKKLEPVFDEKYQSLADSGKKKFMNYFKGYVEEVFFDKYK